MRLLCKIESLALQNCILFQSLSEMTALDDSVRLLLQGTTGPDTSDLDPMALVVDKRTAERRSQVMSAVELRELFESDHEQRYGTHPPIPLHQLRHCILVAYLSMPHNGLPVYGTTAPSRTAQQTLQTVPPQSHCSGFQNCNLTPWNAPALSHSVKSEVKRNHMKSDVSQMCVTHL